MTNASLDYIATGGNRHSSAADWKPGLLAFGAAKNLALCKDDRASVEQLLPGHTDEVTVVRIYDRGASRHVITGSTDKTIRIWSQDGDGQLYSVGQTLEDHSGSINSIATLPQCGLFVSGAADGTYRIWDFSDDTARLVQTVMLKPRYLPLTCSLTALEHGSVVLAVAGTSSSIQLYSRPATSAEFQLQATLTGHEGWIRSLDFAPVDQDGDLLLASASQDKYIRLWRFSRNQEALSTGVPDASAALAKASLSNKTHQVGSEGHKYAVAFEALLIGHEDWIYTARWGPRTTNDDGLRLLSASADNSLAIWQADESSGVWICQTRLGEISAQKGSTTATGSAGGFWIGLWQPDGEGVTSLGRTGSWRRWQHDASSDVWEQQMGVSGHVKEVQGLSWTPDGSYLLSTSSDQTTRLWAKWERGNGKRSWHEFARPQIHGYDLNCIASLSSNQFVSGADEKLLRVFNKPKAIDSLLARLCGHSSSAANGDLPESANVGVLGLSNKAITSTLDEDNIDNQPNGTGPNDADTNEPSEPHHKWTLADLPHPPLEDHLSRQTLFPEHEKLYGHGYEISALAASPAGSLIATACKASSLDHAVIRLYETEHWREVKPPLKVHTLTVTAVAFSEDGAWLVSVGRDRRWALFRKNDDGEWALWKTDPKGHSRMILDCSWAPTEAGLVFATAGRDKAVKIWKITGEEVSTVSNITAPAAVTAVDISQRLHGGRIALAYGTEEGGVSIVQLAAETLEILGDTALEQPLVPSATVNVLRWRPGAHDGSKGEAQLAVGSDDCSVRILNVRLD